MSRISGHPFRAIHRRSQQGASMKFTNTPCARSPATCSTASSGPASATRSLRNLSSSLRNEDRLCIVHEEEEMREPRIICSMGLVSRRNSRMGNDYGAECRPRSGSSSVGSTSASCSSKSSAGKPPCRIEVTLDGRRAVRFTAVAQKRGMVVYGLRHPPARSHPRIPAAPQDRTAGWPEHAHEHLIIFTDPDNSTQIWQWVRREPGKPAACREHTYHQSPARRRPHPET